MKKLLSFLFIVLFISNSFSQGTYSKVRINIQGKDLKTLAAQGIDLRSGIFKKDTFFETDLSEQELQKVKKAGFHYQILIENVSKYYAERAAADPYVLKRNKDEEWPVPDHWELGSMGGFYTLEEIMSELDDMHTLYPDLISPRQALSDTNLTHEGRKQYWVKISDNPDVDEEEPEVLFTGLHHAREPMSYQQMIWFMWYLLENYESDPDIRQMVNNNELYFIPVVNPDGFEYNRIHNPNGGGMWRKNRRNNGDGTYGVDPNRNYGYKWGLDDNGSSPYGGDQTYRGPFPFSEPIIANIRDFCNQHEFKIALNYHSYSNLLLYPWGYTAELPPDHELFNFFATVMTQENHYTIGPANTTIYEVNGDSNDWMYGEQETKEKIFAYVPEIGGSNDGFWPTTSRIVPLCREQMWQNIMAIKLSGKYAMATDLNPIVLNSENGFIKFNLKRVGLMDCDTFTVSIEPLDPSIMQTGNPVEFSNMSLGESRTDSISYTISANPEYISEIKYLLKVDNGSYETIDTIVKYYGAETVLFDDPCNDLNHWNTNDWDITTEDYASPFSSITDSPNQEYNNNTNSMIKLDTAFSLTGTPAAFLTYWAKWDIEEGWDYAQILIKKEGENTWHPLTGKYTTLGNDHQAEGEPLYDGTQNEWVKEEISLSDYLGETIRIAFSLHSDGFITEDGFYFDDLKLSIIGSITGIDKNRENNSLYFSEPFPNPALENISVHYDLKELKMAHYQLLDLSGKIIKQGELYAGRHSITIKTENLTSGIYLLKFKTSAGTITKKVVIR